MGKFTQEKPLSFRPDPGFKQRLEAVAKRDDRSVSWVINKALCVYLALRERFPHERASE